MTSQQYDSIQEWFDYARNPPGWWEPEDGPIELTASFHREWKRNCSYKQPRHMRSHQIHLAILNRMDRRTEAGCLRRGIDYPPF